MSESADPGPIAGPAAPRGDEPVNLGVLGGYIYFNLRLAQGAAFRAFKGQAGVPGLRSGWFAVLSIVNDNPGITPLAVSRATGRDKSTITPILRDLTRERLIARVPIPADRRSYALRLTPEGERALAHLAVSAAEHERSLGLIVGEEREVLLDLLRRIVAELDRA